MLIKALRVSLIIDEITDIDVHCEKDSLEKMATRLSVIELSLIQLLKDVKEENNDEDHK